MASYPVKFFEMRTTRKVWETMATDYTLGQYIFMHRKKMGMTQTDLSTRSGVSYGTISRLENDERVPHRSTLVALATALDVPAKELLDLSPPREPPSEGSRRTLANADVDDQRTDDQATQPETAAREGERKTFADDVDERGDDG
jgi:transcriptional regulator with XRE-family HTH domain